MNVYDLINRYGLLILVLIAAIAATVAAVRTHRIHQRQMKEKKTIRTLSRTRAHPKQAAPVPISQRQNEAEERPNKDRIEPRPIGITICPKCKMRVIPKPDGTCPSCQARIFK